MRTNEEAEELKRRRREEYNRVRRERYAASSAARREHAGVVDRAFPGQGDSTFIQGGIGNLHAIDWDYSHIVEYYAGEMCAACKFCGAKHFDAERVRSKRDSFNDCCRHGEVFMESLPEPPPLIKDLFRGVGRGGNHFFDMIRAYNNAFAFVTLFSDHGQFFLLGTYNQ